MERGVRLEWPVPGVRLVLSVRRIHEHARHRQLNPFPLSPAEISSPAQADAVIDVMRLRDGDTELTGLTLADLGSPSRCVSVLRASAFWLRRAVAAGAAEPARAFVLALARRQAARRAIRNVPAPLLPVTGDAGILGVPHLRSRLCEHLAGQANQRHRPAQWIAALGNLATRGLRQEELQRSGLLQWLQSQSPGEALDGAALRAAIDFAALRISILANVGETRAQVRLAPSAARPLPAPRGIERRQPGQHRELRYFDPVFGYRIEEVARESLWGTDRYWQALTYRGAVLHDPGRGFSICDTAEAAAARVQAHARERYPKLHAAGAWGDYAWTGGEDYREWLITLPCFPWTYLSSHFPLRNVLAHVRCDLREGDEGERVLLLQEVQSDWMQDMRRALADSPDAGLAARAAPLLREWPALALKLMCLHAAYAGYDAIAWLRGHHQVERYRGLGRAGLEHLYDRDLPEAADRMLKPFGIGRGAIDVFVPRNFRIRSVEDRYEVLDIEGQVLGTANTFMQARGFVPDGAHEELHSVHAIRLSPADRKAILETGLPAWG